MRSNAVAVAVAFVVVACKTADAEGDAAENAPSFFQGQFGDANGTSGPDLYADDPFPQWCGGSAAPPAIGGTVECPDDKNKPGCGCSTIGATAKCFTGLRRNRSIGDCKDGVTKCLAKDETANVWGPCEGEVLPEPNAQGRKACTCFSAGEWAIENTAPCLRHDAEVTAMSTVYSAEPKPNCGLGTAPIPAVGSAPTGTWSPNTLTADCAGHFRMCFRIRGGNPDHPEATDCVLGEACTEVDYTTPGAPQKMPDLPTWAGADSACARHWEIETPDDVSPGYGEMIVRGTTLACDTVDDGAGQDLVFHRIPYCPRMCRDGANASAPECVACELAGRGAF